MMAILVRLTPQTGSKRKVLTCRMPLAALVLHRVGRHTAGCRHVFDTQERAQIPNKGRRSAGVWIDSIWNVRECDVVKGW